ncbi:MAG: hypothetical protein WAL83_02800, partial [Arenicellales bacterium]
HEGVGLDREVTTDPASLRIKGGTFYKRVVAKPQQFALFDVVVKPIDQTPLQQVEISGSSSVAGTGIHFPPSRNR